MWVKPHDRRQIPFNHRSSIEIFWNEILVNNLVSQKKVQYFPVHLPFLALNTFPQVFPRGTGPVTDVAGARSPHRRGQGGLRDRLHAGSLAGARDATRQGRGIPGGSVAGGLEIWWKSDGNPMEIRWKYWKMIVLGGCEWNFEEIAGGFRWSKEARMVNDDQTRVILPENLGDLIHQNRHKT